MRKEYKAYVYALINTETDKPFYIGMSSFIYADSLTIENKYWRAYSHFLAYRLNNHYTWNTICYLKRKRIPIETRIIKENITKKEAWELEKTLIKKYGRLKIDEDGILTNMTAGGEGFNSKDASRFIVANVQHRINSSKRLTEYNKSETHKKLTAYYNHIHPKVSSEESRRKLAKSQSETWKNKSNEQKKHDNLAKSVGRAWNVLKRIEGNTVNEAIFNAHRAKEGRKRNTEPLWKTIIAKSEGIEQFLDLVYYYFGKAFNYEN